MAVAFVGVSPFSGWLSARLGARWPTAGGTALIGCGLVLVAGTHGGRPMALAQLGMGVAALGTLAAAGGGLRAAVLAGGLVQFAGAAAALATIR
jgi:hypothetical protein